MVHVIHGHNLTFISVKKVNTVLNKLIHPIFIEIRLYYLELTTNSLQTQQCLQLNQ